MCLSYLCLCDVDVLVSTAQMQMEDFYKEDALSFPRFTISIP